jgi:hypothetical protein
MIKNRTSRKSSFDIFLLFTAEPIEKKEDKTELKPSV